MYLVTDQAGPSRSAIAQVSIKPFSRCVGAVRAHCVVDGDTLWHSGVKVRIADIDTPEIGSPKCAAEKQLGEKATRRLIELVNAGPFEMRAWKGRDEDKYGRKLRVLIRNGRSLGDVLVSEGLARTWTGRKESWC
jgi:endonuclease YncB( thermonuclease family)